MAKDVVSLIFPGDAADLLPRYTEAARRWDGLRPEQAVIAHGDNGLMVTVVWGEGIAHDLLGKHMVGLLEELGLPFPQVQHGTLAAASWEQLVSTIATT
jgi:hypothetical protein